MKKRKGIIPKKPRGAARLTRAQLLAERQRLRARLKELAAARQDHARLQMLVQQLEVHQEEVQIQNQQLIESQKLLEESRDRYADLYDFSPISYITLNPAGHISEINLRGVALLGAARPNLVGTPFVFFVAREYRPPFLDFLRRWRDATKPISIELVLKSRSGHMTPVQLSATAWFDAGSGALHLHTAVLDLTEQKQVEADRERLRVAQQNEVLLRDVLEALPVSVRLVDPSGKLVIQNEASRHLFGDSTGVPGVIHYTGLAWDTETGAPLGRREWPVCQVLEGGGAVMNRMIEIEPAPAEPHKTIRSSAVPLNDAGGKLMGVVLVNEDLTEVRAAQRALQEAKDAAEAAGRLKDEFLATLSHELRTPISAILLWTHLLQTSVKDEDERAAAFETILANAKLQSQLINDLLDLSRVASAKLRLDLQPQLLEPVIHSAIESVRPSAQDKQIALETDFPPVPVAARIDAVRLEQVLLNLLSNAINFTPPHGKVTVSLYRSDKLARIEVSDTGKGISPAFLPHAFDRFRQAEGGSTRSHGGLGLGLAIARELVLGHGGNIRADSDGEGRGATFTIELPAVDPHQASSPLMLRPHKSLDGVRILFVEDEPATRSAVAHILTDAGAKVTALESAYSALEAFRASRPDLIISDIAMPDKDGYEMLREIRQMETLSGELPPGSCPVPAVALTAYAVRDGASEAVAGGFNLHLSKPVDPVALVETVNRFARGTALALPPKRQSSGGRLGNGKPRARFSGGRRKSDPS